VDEGVSLSNKPDTGCVGLHATRGSRCNKQSVGAGMFRLP
jgi:hypothetical protein